MALTTKLEAVNQILAGVGEPPVSSLHSGLVSAATALDKLDVVSKEVQEIGWFFNTETSLRLLPDSNGHLVLPSNTLRVDDVNPSGVVQRGLKLYDTRSHSYLFTQPISVDLVVELSFEELPQAARSYIVYRAKRIFQADYMSDTTLLQVQSQEEKEALYRLKQMDSETSDHNIFDNQDLADWTYRDII